MYDTKIRVPAPSDDIILLRTSVYVIQGKLTMTVSEHNILENISTAVI